MALQTVTIGSMETVHQYDDGDADVGIITSAGMRAGTIGADATDVVRLGDLPTLGTIISSTAVITDHAIVRGDGGARLVQDSAIILDDSGNLASVGTIGCDTITITANNDVELSGTGHVTSGSEGFIVGTLTITDGSIDDTDGSIALGATNLTGVGTIGCGTVTTIGDYILADGNYVGILANERLEFYVAGYANFVGCNVGIGTVPGNPFHVYTAATDLITMFEIGNAGGVYTGIKNTAIEWWYGINAGEDFFFYDGTNTIVTFEDGALANSIYIDSSGNVGHRTATPNAGLDNLGTARLGDSTTNYAVVSATGDLSFVGTAGLTCGDLYLHEGAVTIDISTPGQGTYVKVTGLTTGHLNGVSINSDAFNVGVIGRYKVDWSISGDSDGINKDYHCDIFVNGVEQPEGSARNVFGGAHDLGNMSGTGIIDVTNTGHDIDIRIKEEGAGVGTDIVLYHVGFNITQMGGT